MESHFELNAGNSIINFAVIGRAVGARDYLVPSVSPRTKSVLAPWQAKRAVDFIEENLSETITNDELARLVRLSRSYFATAFKETLGQTPHRYIIGRRMELAKYLLRHSRLSLCDIATDCGLFDQAHLCTLFRKSFGVTPSKWRNGVS